MKDPLYQRLREQFSSGQPAVWLAAPAEESALETLRRVGDSYSPKYVVAEWTCTQGLLIPNWKGIDSTEMTKVSDTDDIIPALTALLSNEAKLPNPQAEDQPGCIVVLIDLHAQDIENDATIKRLFKEVMAKFQRQGNHLVILSPIINMPLDWERLLPVIEQELPDRDTLRDNLFRFVAHSIVGPERAIEAAKKKADDMKAAGEESPWKVSKKDGGFEIKEGKRAVRIYANPAKGMRPSDPEDLDWMDKLYEAMCLLEMDRQDVELIVDAAKGLTVFEAERAYALSYTKEQKVLPEIVRFEKAQAFRKSQLAQIVDFDEKLEDIGGLDLLKEWLKKRSKGFGQKARDFGLPGPKGILLVGVQGCGKSLAAKAIANLYGLPLVRVNLGDIYGPYVGETEGKLRKLLGLLDAVSPCVAWFN